MRERTTTAISSPNIALIKYWGNRDHQLRIPSSGSISMNLDGLYTRTMVRFDPDLSQDELILDGRPSAGAALRRVSRLLDRVREMAGFRQYALVESENSFPSGTGIASSASAFAALSLAASSAAGLELNERELSRLARLGSGSACRSIPGGFVEWHAGEDDHTSFAQSLAPADHWTLVDCIAVVSQAHKSTISEEGHHLADTSPLQEARLRGAYGRLEICRQAILERDFDALARVVEIDSNLMHAVMMTSDPALLYWLPGTIEVINLVVEMRKKGLPVCYTIDAGPNVHVICPDLHANEVARQIEQIPGMLEVLTAPPGGPARLID